MENIQLMCNLCYYFPRFAGVYSDRHHNSFIQPNLCVMLITDDIDIDRMRWNTEAALPILLLTSASASQSHARILP